MRLRNSPATPRSARGESPPESKLEHVLGSWRGKSRSKQNDMPEFVIRVWKPKKMIRLGMRKQEQVPPVMVQ